MGDYQKMTEATTISAIGAYGQFFALGWNVSYDFPRNEFSVFGSQSYIDPDGVGYFGYIGFKTDIRVQARS